MNLGKIAGETPHSAVSISPRRGQKSKWSNVRVVITLPWGHEIIKFDRVVA
jgi:hypothetical protein